MQVPVIWGQNRQSLNIPLGSTVQEQLSVVPVRESRGELNGAFLPGTGDQAGPIRIMKGKRNPKLVVFLPTQQPRTLTCWCSEAKGAPAGGRALHVHSCAE